MASCPSCAAEAPRESAHCPSCETYLGSSRDLVNLATFLGAMLVLIGLTMMGRVIRPNLALARAIDAVRRNDQEGVEAIQKAQDRNEISIKGSDMGWDADEFSSQAPGEAPSSLFLVSFTYTSSQEENQRRYAAWWVFEPNTSKVSKITKAEEFLDGYLLPYGLKPIVPKG